MKVALFAILGMLVPAQVDAAVQDAKEPIASSDQNILAVADLDDKFAQNVVRRSAPSTHAAQLEARLDALTRSVHEQRSRLTDDDLRTLPILRLESLAKHWDFLDHEFRTWRAAFDAYNRAYLDDSAELARRIGAWKSARDRPDIANGPVALLTRINSLEAQLASAQQSLSVPLQQYIRTGERATAVQLEIEAGQRQVAGAIAFSDLRLTRLDAPPLWSPASRVRAPGISSTDRSLAVEADFARDYAAANTNTRHGFMLLALSLLPFLLWLKHRTRDLDAQDPQTQAAARVLRRPIASWILLVLGGLLATQADAPILVHQFLLFMALVPVLRLLPRRVYEALGPWPYIISALYLLSLAGFTLAADPVLHRWYQLGLGLLTMGLLLWFLLARRVAKDVSGNVDRSVYLVRGSGWLAVMLLLVATVANVVGNSTLAEMLVSTSLLSAYLALVLFAGVHVIFSMLHLLMVRRSAERRRIAAEYGGAVLRGFTRLLTLSALIAWLVITLDQLRILGPIHQGLRDVFTHRVGFGAISVSLAGVLLFCFSVWLAFWVARAVRAILHYEVLPAMSLPRGVGNSIASLSYYALIIAGLSAALVAAGFEMSQLTIVLGALGVGIGLGLQGVVNNFVSGLILMFERPIQPGDVIEIGGAAGRVQDIGMRATRLRTFDGADLVVPNGALLSEKLTNWTLTDMKRRVEVSVSVAYGSDPRKAQELLLATARSTPGVASDPEPAAIFSALGDNGLEFVVRAWTNNFSEWVKFRSDLTLQLHDALVAAGFQIPFPQRDIHLRSSEAEVRAAVSNLQPEIAR